LLTYSNLTISTNFYTTPISGIFNFKIVLYLHKCVNQLRFKFSLLYYLLEQGTASLIKNFNS